MLSVPLSTIRKFRLFFFNAVIFFAGTCMLFSAPAFFTIGSPINKLINLVLVTLFAGLLICLTVAVVSRLIEAFLVVTRGNALSQEEKDKSKFTLFDLLALLIAATLLIYGYIGYF